MDEIDQTAVGPTESHDLATQLQDTELAWSHDDDDTEPAAGYSWGLTLNRAAVLLSTGAALAAVTGVIGWTLVHHDRDPAPQVTTYPAAYPTHVALPAPVYVAVPTVTVTAAPAPTVTVQAAPPQTTTIHAAPTSTAAPVAVPTTYPTVIPTRPTVARFISVPGRPDLCLDTVFNVQIPNVPNGGPTWASC